MFRELDHLCHHGLHHAHVSIQSTSHKPGCQRHPVVLREPEDEA